MCRELPTINLTLLDFVCEWCETPMNPLEGTTIEDGEMIGVGYCFKCKMRAWTKPIKVDL